MFTFLHPSILIGLAAVSVPILIHLFTRHKSKTIYFSTLRFLKELQKQQIRRLKIRQILLLILRALIILLLILAFARPTFKQTQASPTDSGAHLTAVIILDNTLSMGRESNGKRLIGTAKKLAETLTNYMQAGDEIYLLYPTNPPQFAYEGARFDLETVRDVIRKTELSYKETDILSAIKLATGLLEKSTNVNRELYLISDMQKVGLPEGGKDKLVSVSENIRFYMLPVKSSEIENLTIKSARFTSQIFEKSKVVELVTEIKNSGEITVKSKLVHLYVNGKRVGQNAVSLKPGSAIGVTFRFVPEKTGFQQAYIQLEEDDFLEDNRHYFSFYIPESLPVLLIGARKQDFHFLQLALTPERQGNSPIKISGITFNKMNEQRLENFDVVMMTNVPRIEASFAAKLQGYVKNGGGLMVFLGPDVDLRNYNTTLQQKLHLPELTQSLTGTADQFLSFGRIDFSHPLFRGIFEDKKVVESPHVRVAIGVQSQKPLDKIIEYSNKQPFLFESDFGKGHVLYVTTGIGNDWSDLTVRGLFVPLVNRAVMYLAGAASYEQQSKLVGESVNYDLKNSNPQSSLSVETPNKHFVKVQPDVQSGNYRVRFNQTNLPGIYQLKNNDTILRQWAINGSSAESELATFDVEQLSERTGFSEIVKLPPDESFAEKLQQSRYGREIWSAFAFAAFFLLFVEMTVFREKVSK